VLASYFELCASVRLSMLLRMNHVVLRPPSFGSKRSPPNFRKTAQRPT
jgi:hypothetical protein